MPKITETATIPLDPEILWNHVGSFDSVGDWHPMLESAEMFMERTSLPVCDYTGEFRIERVGNASRIVWSARFELTPDGDGRTIESIRRFLHAGTESIKNRYGAS